MKPQSPQSIAATLEPAATPEPAPTSSTAPDDAPNLVTARGVTKVFGSGEVAVHALRGSDLAIAPGEFMALLGPSGSGKTTLLNLVGALDSVSAGSLEVLGQDLTRLDKAGRAKLRLRAIGFVFQAYNLVPVLTARENVELVLEMQGVPPAQRAERSVEALAELGLGELADRRPNELSGGQQQRVAVARAVAGRPGLVLADEPTANLDGENAEALMDLMRALRDQHRMSFVFSTHDPRVVAHATRVVHLRDGLVEHDERR